MKALIVLLQSGLDGSVPQERLSKSALEAVKWPVSIPIFSPALVRDILDLLMDPFEEIRSASAKILHMLPFSQGTVVFNPSEPAVQDNRFQIRASRMSFLTARADHSDGVARGRELEFYFRDWQTPASISGGESHPPFGREATRAEYLQSHLQALDFILECKVNDPDPHSSDSLIPGGLAAFRYILGTPELLREVLASCTAESDIPAWQKAHRTLVNVCQGVWKCFKDALCKDSPEGHGSDGGSENREREGAIGAKDTLSLSWRSVKESRQAEAFACIYTKSSVITRRSAGLPALIVGILTAMPVEDASLLERAFSLLRQQSRPVHGVSLVRQDQSIEIPQVHALNMMKEIFTSTRLGARTEKFVAVGLETAAASMQSPIWALRNCGIMLFRALVDRIFGSNEGRDFASTDSNISGKVSTTTHPKLLPIVIKLLASQALTEVKEHASVEVVFPALEILRRAPPPPEQCDAVLRAVRIHMSSRVWAVRAMSARVYALLTRTEEAFKSLQELLNCKESDLNSLHGRLIAVQNMIPKVFTTTSSDNPGIMPKVIKGLSAVRTSLLDLNPHPVVQAAYLDCLSVVVLQAARITKQDHRAVMDELLQFRDLTAAKGHGLRHKLSRHPPTRLSLSKFMSLFFCLEGNSAGMKSLMAESDLMDPDTARYLLEYLKENILLSTDLSVSYALATSLAETFVAQSRSDVLGLALSNLADMVEGQPPLTFKRAYNTVFSSSRWIERGGEPSPVLSDGLLRLEGLELANQCSTGKDLSGYLEDKTAWTLRIRAASHEDNDFLTRKAAISSLDLFVHGLYTEDRRPNPHPAFLQPYLTLYDILSDDDEDIRDHAAAITCHMLSSIDDSGRQRSMIPLAAASELMEWISTTYADSNLLCYGALDRLFGLAQPKPSRDQVATGFGAVGFPSFQTLLSEARKEDKSLFAEEKQNLFYEPCREAEAWGRILHRLKPGAAVSLQLMKEFIAWTLQAVNTLTEVADREVDGPLGWTAKPDVFALGVRALVGASVAISWARASGDTMAKVHEMELILALMQLGHTGGKSQLHEAWMDLMLGAIEQR
ncbi:MAG: hypothetical protein M1825_001477 [Sarcosagium campestre]|nr:MAG: hypothetical protein M1825_001477 [Sarcosagium campestre]